MKYIYTLSLLLILSSCNETDTFTKIDGGKFTIELPSNLSETKDLNQDAVLQYQNIFSEFYAIVIEDDYESIITNYPDLFDENEKLNENSLTEYVKIVMYNYLGRFPSPKEINFKPINLNGQKAITTSFTKEVNEHKIIMKFLIVQGKSNFYQVATWTLDKNKKTLDNKMNKILNSFKEKGIKKRLNK